MSFAIQLSILISCDRYIFEASMT